MSHRFYSSPVSNHGGLHSLDHERDSCGVGFIANIHGERSHKVLRAALTSVCNVVHRGAVDADQKTGDGAGVTTQVPHKLLVPEAEAMGARLAQPTDLGVGVFFLPRKEMDQIKVKLVAEGVLRNRGVRVFGWREVPVNKLELGEKARRTMPLICHLLLGRPEGLDDDQFERMLFLARREMELKMRREDLPKFYIPSLSHRTISYKAMVVATALEKFFKDLHDERYETAIALYHQRFSTNTFPSWALAQPFRMLAHNGEINTLKGNRNWMASRESDFESEVWGSDVSLLKNLIDPQGSDSASLDNALELLVLSGRSLPHAISMLVPPAYGIDPTTTAGEKAYYEYYSGFSEPWDGPAALVFTDGLSVAASLDRNGLRPSRFKLTEDGLFTLGSEVGVVKIDDATVIRKGRLAPGEMVVIDTIKGEVRYDKEIKAGLAAMHPYGDWLREHRVELTAAEPAAAPTELDILSLSQKQVAFGYNKEEIDMAIVPMIQTGNEAIYSMGDDTPLAVLSHQPRLLYTYFKQLFAQVTNPPIDPIRERAVMDLGISLGWQRNLLAETPEHAEVAHVQVPFLFENELEQLRGLEQFPHRVLDMTWNRAGGPERLAGAIDRLCEEAEAAVADGVRILILSDRATAHDRVPIPALLATGTVHHHLNRLHLRMRLSLVVDSGEARDCHQMACLFGYGASAICPYLAFESIHEALEADKAARKPKLEGIDYKTALNNYRKALEKGVLKIMSKMGISVLNSYSGAQIFEAVGLSRQLVEKCFTGTRSVLDGIGFDHIARESIARHDAGFAVPVPDEGGLKLDDPGYNRWRRSGERHSISGPVIKSFHAFVRSGEEDKYEEYVRTQLENNPVAIKDLLDLVPGSHGPIDLSEVEPIEDIRVRFTTAGMSLGALSPEAHEALAIAMNRIHGKSNSGEGGEDPRRFKPYENGDWGNSAIKQVASGRFGVSAEYLANAVELEIKMAQGAKPGEGGQLPGHKVDGLIARLRHTVPGVTLISPPPHHDIYSIEDLAQLIHDLKEVNPRARVCVKLVAESGVGTIAAGVAKAHADIILISGHDGGTGASPLSSIKSAGLPWEIGLAETQQVLQLNGLRDRVTLRTDGGLRNGRDIITAALLGAEEFNFGTIALIALGCVYVRQCHLNTCPVGVATQRPDLRAKFKGDPQHVVNFFNAVAHETRGLMAMLGYRTLDELIGRTAHLRVRQLPDHPKASTLDLSPVLRDVAAEKGEELPRICRINRNDGVHAHPLDDKILQEAHIAITDKRPVTLDLKVRNTNRNVGTKLSGEIAYHHGNHALPDGTITLNFDGSAGQSFGTFLVSGVRMVLTGEANDYVGKGMCGGDIIIKPRPEARFNSWENSIIGNTVLYGATGGRLFAAGCAGERFAVRNSGAVAVVEGVGDHGCEYMTGGIVVILGGIGKNFGAGMSGGTAYIYDPDKRFELLRNPEMIEGVPVVDPEDQTHLRSLVEQHLERTGSARARQLLENWQQALAEFVKAQPYAVPTEPSVDEAEPSEAPAAVGR